MTIKKNTTNSFELMAIHFRNELKAIFSDKGAVLILMGALIIYPILYSFGYFNEVLINLPVGVVDLDQSSCSRKYSNMLDASREVDIACKPVDLTQAENLFMDNKINGVLLIPKGFEEDILSGKQTNVALYADGSYMLKYKTVYTALSLVNVNFGESVAVHKYMAEGKSLQQAKIDVSPLDIQTHTLYNPSGSYGSFIMPGLIIIIIQQTLLIGIGIMGGTFSESKASPFVLSAQNRYREIIPLLFGRVGAYLLISMFNVCLSLVLVHDWFNYPDKGNLLEIIMLIFPFLLAVIFFGIGLSTFFKHRESAIVFMMFLSPIALFLTGLSWPISAIPEWLAGFSQILPGTIVVPAYLRLRTMGAGIMAVKPELLKLYLQAVIYAVFTIAYYFLRMYTEHRANTYIDQKPEQNTLRPTYS